jgi:hypothetical protein
MEKAEQNMGSIGSVPHEIILIYDADCPNVEAARRNLREAIADTGRVARWKTIDRGDPTSPAEYRRFGSPTILIDGQDVAGIHSGTSGNCCRVYVSANGRFVGAPSVEQISARLLTTSRCISGPWRNAVWSIPALAVGLLPSVTCPACWPGYAALLGAFGVGFIPTSGILLPLTVVSLVLLLGALVWQAFRTRRCGPAVLAGAAAALLLLGRFVWPVPPLHYAGLVALIVASIWNLRLKPSRSMQANSSACPPVVSLE